MLIAFKAQNKNFLKSSPLFPLFKIPETTEYTYTRIQRQLQADDQPKSFQPSRWQDRLFIPCYDSLRGNLARGPSSRINMALRTRPNVAGWGIGMKRWSGIGKSNLTSIVAWWDDEMVWFVLVDWWDIATLSSQSRSLC